MDAADYFYQHPQILRDLAQTAFGPPPAEEHSANPQWGGDRLIETHISKVLLSGPFVFKFKKKANFAFIEQVTTAQKLKNCLLEVELNGHLAPGIYLGVLETNRLDGEHFTAKLYDTKAQHDEVSPTQDYCVVMRRLNDDDNFLGRLRKGALTGQHIDAVAQHLAHFHRDVPKLKIDRPHPFFKNYQDNIDFLHGHNAVPAALIKDMAAVLNKFKDDVLRRHRHGRIVMGHGDLRLDHLYIHNGQPVAVDCVEFNEGLRTVDPVEDMAFVTVGMHMEDRPDLAHGFSSSYFSYSLDPAMGLLPLFEIYRAAVRAKIDLLQLAQSEDKSQNDYLKNRLTKYLELITNLSRLALGPGQGPRARLHVFMGLPATGKSTAAKELGTALNAPIIASDRLRKQMLGLSPQERAGSAGFDGAYSPAMTRRVYRRMHALARIWLPHTANLVLDATYARRQERQALRSLARRAQAQLSWTEVSAPESTIRQRLQARKKTKGLSDLDDFSIWRQAAARFEEPDAQEKKGEDWQKRSSPGA